MPATPDAQADIAAALEPSIRPATPWRVAAVKPLPDYRLHVRFVDGLVGEVHMKELVNSSRAGVFEALRDRRVFEQVHVHWGAVTWPSELDLAPDAMYDDISATGVCLVRPSVVPDSGSGRSGS